MRRPAGQAARAALWLLQGLAQFIVTAVVAAAILTGVLAWRLSQGPLEIGWVARRLEAAADTGAARHLRAGSAALTWNGWRLGSGAALGLVLDDAAMLQRDGAPAATLAHAQLSVALGSLLAGHVVPRALELDGARLRVRRAANGATSLDLGALGEPAAPGTTSSDDPSGLAKLLDEMSRPPVDDTAPPSGPWSQLRRLTVHDAQVTVLDRQLGADWSVPHAEIAVRRRDGGGMEGEGDIQAALGDQTLRLALHAAPTPDKSGSRLHAELTPFTPAAMASKAPGLAPLAALDAQLTLTADADLDRMLRPRDAAIHAEIGAGRAHFGKGEMPLIHVIADARVSAEGGIEATLVRLETAPRPDGPRSILHATVRALRDGARYATTAVVDLDQVAFADLAAIWPEGVGGRGTRPWVTTNITAGVARNAHVEAHLAIPADMSGAELLSVSGGIDASDLSVSWLRPVPPIEHGDARLTFIDPETIEIAVLSGRQAGGTHGGIAVRHGTVRITGLADKDQFADITADLTGPLPDLLTLLKHPRIRLLDRRPMEMRDPSGGFDGRLTVSRLPFKNDMSMDELQIHTVTHLTEVHLGGIAAGRDIDGGTLDLDAGNDGLTVKGDARVAGIPTQLSVALDFRQGPPSQVLTSVTANANADEKQIAALGFDPAGIIAGPVALQLAYKARRDNAGDITLHADLTRTAVTVTRARVRKVAGSPATVDLHAILDHDRLSAIDRVLARGDGILVQGAADMVGGRPNVLKLERVRLGDTTDANGEIRLPKQDGDAYVVALAGSRLDLSGEFGHDRDASPPPPAEPTKTDPGKPGTPYTADIRFDRVLTAGGQALNAVEGHVENDGRIIRRARLSGRTAPDAPFKAVIEPAPGGRRLSAEAADLGTLLRAADVASDVNGGRAFVSGSFDDTRADHRLTGTVDLTEFRLRGQAALGKVLQGLTLYGLVDVLSGPGLNFDKLAAPFRYANQTLELTDARAFSSSLGLTAKGRIDFGRDTIDLAGTVVPAYFLNSMLGRIPVLGRIFSHERGGGVLAVNYTLSGKLADPSVGVNPLSVLTPGFLRGFFDIFDRTGDSGARTGVQSGRDANEAASGGQK